MTSVHLANSFFKRHDLFQINLRKSFEDSSFDGLDFIIESLDFFSTGFVEVLVEQRNVLLFELSKALLRLVLKEASDASWMNDLVTWTQREVHEAWNSYARLVETQRHEIADEVYPVSRE